MRGYWVTDSSNHFSVVSATCSRPLALCARPMNDYMDASSVVLARTVYPILTHSQIEFDRNPPHADTHSIFHATRSALAQDSKHRPIKPRGWRLSRDYWLPTSQLAHPTGAWPNRTGFSADKALLSLLAHPTRAWPNRIGFSADEDYWMRLQLHVGMDCDTGLQIVAIWTKTIWSPSVQISSQTPVSYLQPRNLKKKL